jgi:hypothetical protein
MQLMRWLTAAKRLMKTVSDIAANKAAKEAAQKLAEKGAKGWKTPGKHNELHDGKFDT